MEGKLIRPKPRNKIARFFRDLKGRLSLWRYNTGFSRFGLKGKHPLRLIASPDNPWMGSMKRGADFLDGQFTHAGFQVDVDVQDLWVESEVGPEAFYGWSQSFCWLADLDMMADKPRARARAEGLMRQWLNYYGEWNVRSWRQDLIGDRILYWILHAPLILASDDQVYRSKVLNSLARQARHLDRSVLRGPDGLPRIRALIGLILSGMLLPFNDNRYDRGIKLLQASLGRLVMADGGFKSRSVIDVMATAKLLITLKSIIVLQNRDLPAWIQQVLDRMVPYLKAQCHGDGGFAQFQGAFEADAEGLEKIYLMADAKGRPIDNASLSGFQRLQAKKSLVLVDVGPPPPYGLSDKGTLAPLAMEFSDGRDRLVANTGGNRPGWSTGPAQQHALCRTAPYHSTMFIDELSPGQIDSQNRIIGGGETTWYERQENEHGLWLSAAFEGHVEGQKVRQERRLFLSAGGEDLRGEDSLTQIMEGTFARFKKAQPRAISVRFHLHPKVTASLTREGKAIILRSPSGRGWLFRAKGGELQLAEGRYYNKEMKTQRSNLIILVAADGSTEAKFNWSFKRLDTRD